MDIQTRMLADVLNLEESDILRAVHEYTEALTLLDQYDHQCLGKPEGITPVYRITYDDCMSMVSRMKDSFGTDVFGIEKEAGKVDGIIAAIYQSAFGQDAYPSLFLEFLERNHELYLDGRKRIGDGELVAITLMIAESNPEEKEIRVSLHIWMKAKQYELSNSK